MGRYSTQHLKTITERPRRSSQSLMAGPISTFATVPICFLEGSDRVPQRPWRPGLYAYAGTAPGWGGGWGWGRGWGWGGGWGGWGWRRW
jgi:hypothetical protein